MFLFFYNIFSLALCLLQFHVADCIQAGTDVCDSSCSGVPASDEHSQIGLRYTYRYRTMISSTLQGSGAGRNGLALDCEVDLDVVSKCHLIMQIRNPQVKRLSTQREHLVQSLKSLRESLERARLKFSLRGGRVTALCLQEGEQVWVRNIQRAVLSMLQTSATAAMYTLQNETDVHGTCSSRYERRGPVVLKTRDLNQCQQSRLANLWPRSVPMSDETALQAELQCVQRRGPTMMEEVNCTESVTMAMMSRNTGRVKTQTVSTLILLRAQPAITASASGFSVLTDLQFEDEASARTKASTSDAAHTVRTLCGLSDQRLISQELLQLVYQLRDLTLSQLKSLWLETSFKCRYDWQPLLDALSMCGSEDCVLLLTGLMSSTELEEGRALSILGTLPLIPRPTSQIIASVNTLLGHPQLRSKAMLVGSSLVHQLCRTSHSSCTELLPVKLFLQRLKEALQNGCESESAQVKEVLFTLKSVGNAGVFPSSFIPLLCRCALSKSAPPELRLAAVQAFRRMPCAEDRSVLLQLYGSSQEDPEVRIAAYQQLLLCPNQDLFTAVRDTLRNETSSQVGSYVWSHLSSVLRSEDPLKQSLIESLPDDIISRDFEGEFLKYSSYSDHTVVSDLGITNVETSLVFSPKSFLPRSASANLTMYIHGRASNLLEVDLRVESFEPFLKNMFGHEMSGSSGHSQKPTEPKETKATRGKAEDRQSDKETCLSGPESYLSKASALLFRRRDKETLHPQCWISIKVFGNEVSVFSCEDIHSEINQFSLSMAELAVKLLKGQEVQLSHRAVLLTEELVLPSLSGLPLKLSLNMTSLLSLRLRGSAHYRDGSHFSLNGYVKPNAYVGLVSRMGVDSALGQAAVEWDTTLRSALSLDGSVQVQEGQDLRVMLNTPEDVMDIISISSHVFQLSGDNREEIKGSKNRIQKTTCTPKTLSKMVGWQLCSNASYPFNGLSLPPPGPAHFSLRLLKLDRGLHYYLLEAAYSLLSQRGTWIPREASLHLLLATPQSSVPRDMSLDLALTPQRLLLRLNHPMKTVIMQGQLEQDRSTKSAKAEIMIDGAHFYILGLIDKQVIASEQRTRYHVEAKLSTAGAPMILSANVTRGLGRKTSFSASVRNVFRETASVSVALERRRDSSSRQYSVEGELLLPGLVGGRMLGLMEQKGSLWSSALRLKYGLGGEARHLLQECFTSQRLKSERDSNRTYIMRADHEFYCSNTAAVNHKVQVRHEESPSHVKSSLDLSYGKHWDEINNKHKLILSQMFKNQSTHNHTSYTLEFSLQAPDKNLNYKTQLLHSYQKHLGSESSTHLKIHYNNLTPLVAGLHWRGPPRSAPQKKWEGTFNMDTPWLYIYTSHKLSRQQPRTLLLSSELSCSKWITVRNLALEALYRDRGREMEARLHVHSPAITYLETGAWALVGKKSVKASCSLKSLWTSALGGELSLETSKLSHTLQITSSYGRHNATVTAALSSADKKLKKRQALLKMSWRELPQRPTEFLVEGVVEELKRDKKMYQKVAKLQLRQPFQLFPESLILQETFTADNLKGLYVLESRALFSGNKEVLHTLTIGHQPPKPFVCSALIHPFSYSVLPSDSEICVNLFTNQTQKHIHGRLRTGSKDRLSFFGNVHFKTSRSQLKGIQVKANFTHQLQLRLPSAAIVEADVCWTPENNAGFDYRAKGKLKIERQECKVYIQLNGTSSTIGLFSSLSHPFKSKIPKVLEAKATADFFTGSGGGRSSVHLRADGKDEMTMDAQVFHTVQTSEKTVGLKINVSQSLLPTTKNLFVDIGANMSSGSVNLYGSYKQAHQTLLTQIRCSHKNIPRLQMAVSGDVRHNIRNLAFLPSAVGLHGTLGKTDGLVNGKLRVKVKDFLYRVELRHQNNDTEEGGLNVKGNKSLYSGLDWMCVWSGSQKLCINVSHRLGDQHWGEVYTELSHSFHRLKASGVPSRSSAKFHWEKDNGQMSGLAEINSGVEHLKAEFYGGGENRLWEFDAKLEHQVKSLVKSGLPNSVQAKALYKLESDGLLSGVTFIVEDKNVLDIIFNIGSKDSSALLAVTLRQQVNLLQGVLPTALQINCTGDVFAEHLSVQCYGDVAGCPLESTLSQHTSFNMSVSRSGCSAVGSFHLSSTNTETGSVSVSLQCQPALSFKASVQQSLDVLRTLGFPPRGEVTLIHSPPPSVGVEVGLQLGSCYFKGHLGKILDDYSVNATSYCPALQESSLPMSLAVVALLSGVPCQLTLSSSLRADDQDLSLVLQRSCSPQHVSASVSHSFRELRRRGLHRDLSLEATAPWGPEHSGALLIKTGECRFKANGVKQDNGWTQWTLESDCPVIEAHVNGSVWQDPQGVWTAVVETSLDKKRGLLRVKAGAQPELHLESELSHNLPAFRNIPQHSRMRVDCQTQKQPYTVETVVQVDDCVVRAKAQAQHGLQGELLYHHNCTLIEKWGGPHSVHVSGSWVATSDLAKSQVFMTIDDSELQTSVTVKNMKIKNEASLFLNHSLPFLKSLGLPLNASVTVHSGNPMNGSFSYVLQSRVGPLKFLQEVSVLKMFEGVRVQSSCRHSVEALKKLGLPANSSIQVELKSGEGKGLMLQSWFGSEQVGLNLKLKCLHLIKELKAAVWHSWSWLQDRGVPVMTEGVLSLLGYFPQLQSRAQLTVDGHKLMSSGLNVSAASGRLSAILSYVPPTSNQTFPQRLETTVTAQFKGPLRSASIDVCSPDWRMVMMGDVGGWGGTRGSKEARVTLRHTVHSQSSPAFQMEAWGRMSESQLRCSLALNPELSSSLALILQGHHLPHSNELMLKIVQKIPRMLMYLPPHLNVRTQLNQSQSSVSSLVEVLSGRRRLWAVWELAAIESGYRQTLELKHSYPKLKPLPRMVSMRTVYESREWSYLIQHEALWGNQEVSLSGLYSAPPFLDMGNHTIKVHISSVPRWTNLDLALERFPQGRLDELSLQWRRHGRLEQVHMLSLWSRSEEVNETKLELQQPFSTKLRRLSLSSVSLSSTREQSRSQQTHLLWDGAVNIALDLNKQWQDNSSKGQACAIFSSQQMSLSPVKGCLSAVQEGNSYSQNSELRWDNRSVKHGLKYQRGQRGLHSLQLNVWLDGVSSAPCSSHTLLAKIQTNLRDRLDHTLLLGICPPQPGLSWSGSHRVNLGDELFYTQSRVSLTQRPHHCSITVALTNSSTPHRTNISLFSESRFGNWTAEVGGTALSWKSGSSIEVQTRLDRREKVWLNGSLTGRCLQTTAGYANGPDQSEDVGVRMCLGKDRSITFDVEGKDSAQSIRSLGSVSVGTGNQKLSLKAQGCLESLAAVEAQFQYWSFQLSGKLLEKVNALQYLLTEFRRQSRESEFAQELSAMLLHGSKRLEALLLPGTDRGVLVQWQKSTSRQFVTENLPQFLVLLQHASLLGQQELRRPLATLAGVYQDVKGQRVEALWREVVSLWTRTLREVVPVLLDNPQLQPLVRTCVTGLSVAVDVAGQQSHQWLENRLALVLSGVRKRLASVYKLSPRECSVSVSVPLPQLHWPGTNEAELVRAALEEWLLKPLQSLASIRPTAELYRLKRKIMESPFIHQALLVSDQFVLTYDGHILELPRSCPLLLARSVSAHAFSLILNPNSDSFLMLGMNNNNVSIQQNGQVKVNCHTLVTNTFVSGSLSVKRGLKVVEVSNQNGVSFSCDLSSEVCSLTLDGWLHGTSTGLMGTNDNEAGNDFFLPNGSRTENLRAFFSSWQIKPGCSESPVVKEHFEAGAINPVSCDDLFSSLDSPLSSCFRVVDPGEFLTVCQSSSHRSAPCRLASAFAHVCQQNYIPLQRPTQCVKV